MLYLFAAPVLSLGLVVGAVAGRGLSAGARRVSMVAAILIACGALTLVRTNGLSGDAGSDFEWRWTPTAEERLLARAGDERLAAARGAGTGITRSEPLDTAREGPLDVARGGPIANPPENLSAKLPNETATTPAPTLADTSEKPRCQARAREAHGPGFVDRRATAWSTACGSKRTGLAHRRWNCGASPSGRAGHPSLSPAIDSSHRNSAATMRSYRRTT